MPDIINPQILDFMSHVLWHDQSPWAARNKVFGNMSGALEDIGGCILFENPRMYDESGGKARITNLFYAPQPKFYQGYLLPSMCLTPKCKERGEFGFIGVVGSNDPGRMKMPRMHCRKCKTKFVGTAEPPGVAWPVDKLGIGSNHFIWTWHCVVKTHPQLHDWVWQAVPVNVSNTKQGPSKPREGSKESKPTSPTKSPARKKVKQ